jgi:indoleamine 2,3-dioxygenase
MSYSDGFFDVSPQHGFLPIQGSLKTLPMEYSSLQHILDHMPVTDINGDEGYLSTPGLLPQMVKKLPDYTDLVNDESNKLVLAALFRGYTFLASSYLLEPAYQHFKVTGEYGKANRILPSNIAKPLCTVASKLDVFPWLDYSYAYALGNYRLIDPKGGLVWSNLKLNVSFSGKEDERGFILVHVDINQFSPYLIESFETILGSSDNVQMLDGLKLCLSTMLRMNERRQQMWAASQPTRYNDFRIFIMGIEGNDAIFGDGVIYEGVSDQPKRYRGQSGSQDTIIPTLDTMFRVIDYYPKNELTEYLLDMRKYRPKVFQRYLRDLEDRSLGIWDQVEKICGAEGLLLVVDILTQIYHFRNGHWQFVQKYIMGNTKYNVATGGTPVTTWIPNQIEATLKAMEEVMKRLEQQELSEGQKSDLEYHQLNLDAKVELLSDQIKTLSKNFNARMYWFEPKDD